MTKKSTRIHVVPNKDGDGWSTKREGSDRASRNTDTKKEAEESAKKTARREGGEVIIHGKDGKIQDSDSYGNDPNPPKDKKH